VSVWTIIEKLSDIFLPGGKIELKKSAKSKVEKTYDGPCNSVRYRDIVTGKFVTTPKNSR
jgi:hypothetical protein